MQIEKLRSLIRESVKDHIKEIEAVAEAAAMEARLAEYDKAIKTCEDKITKAENLEEVKELVDEGKLNELKKKLKDLKKTKEKLEKQKAKKKGKEVTTDAETDKEESVDETVDAMDETYVEETYNMDKMGMKDESLNESFLKMQKLAGVITESQYNQKRRLVENYTPPAYEAINDLMDYIKQSTGVSGNIKPYRSISWLPSVSDTDGDMDMLTYKKGKQEIAIGVDDVYQDQYDENSNVWVINSNDSSLDFGEHMTFDEAVKAVSGWLKSSSSNQSNYGMDDQDMLRNLGWNA